MNHIPRAIYYTNKNGNVNLECDFLTPIQHQFGVLLGLHFSKRYIYFSISVLLEEP